MVRAFDNQMISKLCRGTEPGFCEYMQAISVTRVSVLADLESETQPKRAIPLSDRPLRVSGTFT